MGKTVGHRLWGLLVVLGLAAFSPPGIAQDYRELEFEDGRSWLVNLKGSDSEGMLVEMHQGEAQVSYDDVKSIREIEPGQYDDAVSWKIRLVAVEAGGQEEFGILAKAVKTGLVEAIDRRPGMKLQSARVRVQKGVPGDVPLDCGIASTVSISAEASRGVDYLVSAFLVKDEAQAPSLLLCGQYTGGSQRIQRWTSPVSEAGPDVGRGLSAVLGLIHPVPLTIDEPPKPLVSSQDESDSLLGGSQGRATGPSGGPDLALEAAEQEPPDIELDPDGGEAIGPDLRRLAFVPLPGFPSLYVRDMPRFGRAWLAAVPLTGAAALWINGSVTFRTGQSLFLTTAAYYAITVGTNQYMARESGVVRDQRYSAEP